MKWKIQTPSGPQAPYLSAMGWLPSGDQVFYTIKQSREWKYEVSKEIRVAKDIEDVATAISEAEKDLTDSGGQSLH